MILALGGFCDEDEQELGILHSSSWMYVDFDQKKKKTTISLIENSMNRNIAFAFWIASCIEMVPFSTVLSIIIMIIIIIVLSMETF